jgi:trimethyllysine dioxygenase
MIIQSIQPQGNGLNIYWNNGSSSCFPWLWLRDHSESEIDLHPDSKQRQIDVFSETPDNSINRADIDNNKKNIIVKWSDNTESRISFDLLYSMSTVCSPSAQALSDESTWNSVSDIKFLPEMPYDEFLADEGLNKWLNYIKTIGFVLVTDTPATAEATKDLMERMSYVRNSIFGGFSVWDNKLEDPDDTAFTSLSIEPHTDGTYVHDAPGLQTLHCLKKNSIGGENQLVDGLAIAEKMRNEYPEFFKILSKINIPGRYIKTDTYLEANRPLFRVNDEEKVVQVSFNNHDRAPFRLDNESMLQFYEAYKVFHNFANDKNRQFQFMLEPGKVLTFDNWRVLHARSALAGYRQLCGGYHNREDFESKLRLI